jgi:hypothetical protein
MLPYVFAGSGGAARSANIGFYFKGGIKIMARIRTFKPEFFRHEKLQDLELEHQGKYPMFVFEGLWSLCDKNGVFLFKPRQIKLDILPFLPFDMAETLKILEDANFIIRYTVDNNEYGYIPTFLKHQRISGEEGKQQAKYPIPPNDAGQTQEGSRSDAGQTQEGSINSEGSCPGKGKGKGKEEREEEREEERIPPFGGSDFENPVERHFIQRYQSEPAIFNMTARIENFTGYKAWWTEYQDKIDIAMIDRMFDNIINGINSGALERRFIPKSPDKLVLNGWIQRGQESFIKKSGPSPPKRAHWDHGFDISQPKEVI